MELISAKEVLALGAKRRRIFSRLENRRKKQEAESVQKCYDKCIEHLNAKLTDSGKANCQNYQFSFIDLLGKEEYHLHASAIHDRVVKDLEAKGYKVTHPGWHDHEYEMIEDGIILIQWI